MLKENGKKSSGKKLRKMEKSDTVSASATKSKGLLSDMSPDLINDIRVIIEQTRSIIARSINSAQVLLYWDIGSRVQKEVLKSKRALYGKEIVATLSQQLMVEFGKGFSKQNLHRMVQIVIIFPDREKVSTLSRQLGWSHFVEILPQNDLLKCSFYAEMCRIERWSVRTLRAKIDGMLFERTAIAKKPEKVIELELKNLSSKNELSADMVFRDPYLLDFLQLTDPFSEKDLESAAIREMEKFILELGAGFTFIERQKRMTIDGEDYYLDLLFYNRYLNRLVAIDLKLGRFQASDKGQMELYLRWLERHEMQKHESVPIGLILCAGKSDEHVELLQLSRTGIRVASYMTELPPKEVLERTLHRAIERARLVLESRTGKGKQK